MNTKLILTVIAIGGWAVFTQTMFLMAHAVMNASLKIFDLTSVILLLVLAALEIGVSWIVCWGLRMIWNAK